MFASFKCHQNVHSILNKHLYIIFIHYKIKEAFFIMILRLESDPANIIVDVIC